MALIPLKWVVFAWLLLATNVLGKCLFILQSKKKKTISPLLEFSWPKCFWHTLSTSILFFISFSLFSYFIPGETRFSLDQINSASNGLVTAYETDISNNTSFASLNADYDEIDDKFRCIKCNTNDDANNCTEISDMVLLANCTSSYGQCYTAIKGGIVHRGCVGDYLFPDPPSVGNSDYMTRVCNNDRYCNQENITDTCIICRFGCTYPTLEDEKACSFDQDGAGCYLRKRYNGDYERGCVKDLTEPELIECDRSGSDYCQRCVGRNCNKKKELYQTCYFCNGTYNKNCFGTVDKAKGATTTCTNYSNQCLVGVDAEGYTHRQCSSTEENDSARFPNGYKLCDGDLCNGQVFPSDRMTCFKCKSKDRDGCAHPLGTMVPQYCRLLNDECFIYGIEGIDRHIRKKVVHLINYLILFVMANRQWISSWLHERWIRGAISLRWIEKQLLQMQCHKVQRFAQCWTEKTSWIGWLKELTWNWLKYL